MRVMLSATSLGAFSGASALAGPAPSAAARRPAQPSALHQARAPNQPQQSGAAPALPDARPSLPPPRGTLLNLSV